MYRFRVGRKQKRCQRIFKAKRETTEEPVKMPTEMCSDPEEEGSEPDCKELQTRKLCQAVSCYVGAALYLQHSTSAPCVWRPTADLTAGY
ncbi:hypothetical protein NDU88_003104 [Pleurodeles waltl]|uniref:Uncharacterized protein n=1 Tax=Pleurodeles waltl TaxID=8319 RepID=A0AAV7MRI5_PLEWA|nr:hypothetical protein NDU88_003104 [Pleurodeles waltl]